MTDWTKLQPNQDCFTLQQLQDFPLTRMCINKTWRNVIQIWRQKDRRIADWTFCQTRFWAIWFDLLPHVNDDPFTDDQIVKDHFGVFSSWNYGNNCWKDWWLQFLIWPWIFMAYFCWFQIDERLNQTTWGKMLKVFKYCLIILLFIINIPWLILISPIYWIFWLWNQELRPKSPPLINNLPY